MIYTENFAVKSEKLRTKEIGHEPDLLSFSLFAEDLDQLEVVAVAVDDEL